MEEVTETFNGQSHGELAKKAGTNTNSTATTINWGDGTVQTFNYPYSAIPEDRRHIYTTPGSYKIKVTAANAMQFDVPDHLSQDTISFPMTVQAEPVIPEFKVTNASNLQNKISKSGKNVYLHLKMDGLIPSGLQSIHIDWGDGSSGDYKPKVLKARLSYDAIVFSSESHAVRHKYQPTFVGSEKQETPYTITVTPTEIDGTTIVPVAPIHITVK